jgi:site-specific DNA-methyltransferase (adenine-specific)/site-specific DNA-methyltransferase (cytosine-N4-specific)
MKLDTVIHGDCISTLAELYSTSGEFADLIIFSPPYAEQRKDTYGGIPEEDYPNWMLSVVRAGMRILKPTGSLVLNIKEHVNDGVRSLYVLETTLLLAKEFRFVDEFIWNKTNPFPTGSKKRLKDGFERCLHFTKTSDYQFFPDSVLKESTSKWVGNNERRKNMTNGSGMNMSKRIAWKGLVRPSNVITMPASSLNIQHPAAFPIALPDFFIRLMTKEGDVVVDPFLGSGTTVLAAAKLGRQFLGIERNEGYVQLAESRIAAMLRERE